MAVPGLRIEAELEGRLTLEASSAADPRRFDAGLTHGSWLTGRSKSEVILPAAKVRQIAQGLKNDEVVGRVVEIRFQRRKRIAAAEPELVLPLKVVGIVDGDSAQVPLELLRQVSLWADGATVFNEAKMEFEAPAAIYARRGHVRCNIYATDLASVKPLVGALRKMGYHTEDRLADQQGLRRLGQALGFVVGAFGFGCLFVAGKMIVMTTMMNVQTKRWEIGILKAHGMRTRSILSIFAMQGALVGVAACVLGVGFVAIFEPVLRDWIRDSFQIPMDTIIAGSFWSLESAWFVMASIVAALLLSTIGVALPALGAAAKLPVETLQRRE